MASFIKLKNTPIKEIIFTISFNENVPVEKLDIFTGLPQIKNTFPIVDKGFNTHLVAKPKEQPTSKTSIDSYILRSLKPLSKIIQARKGSFSFHKVNGYEHFEKLISELHEYWGLFVQCTGVLTVNNISVRYLNFIEKDKEEDFIDLVTIHTQHPFGKEIESNFTQYRFKYDSIPTITANVITAKGKDGLKEGIVLDIILNKKIEMIQNIEIIFSSFYDLRIAKNDLFFRSITEKTINKYNQ